MLEALITSKTRIKLLLKFFLNPSTSAYLRGLESELGESSNSIRLELNRLKDAGMLTSSYNGNKKMFQVNKAHPLYDGVHQIIRRYVGLDVLLENIIKQLGDLKYVYLTGEIAKGKDSKVIDLILVGDVNRDFLLETIEKIERLIDRRIRFLIYSEGEYDLAIPNKENTFLLWSA